MVKSPDPFPVDDPRRHMPGTRYAALRGQILRFGASTGFSASMSFLLPIALHEVGGVPSNYAVAIGFLTAYLGNLVLLKMFVFRSKGNWRRQTWRYMVVNGLFRLCEYGSYFVLANIVLLDYRLAVFLVLSVAAVLKFFAYRLVFVGRPDRACA